ncbi:MAG TPA: YaeQ family protein [Thermoanaerobaculia bacterium]|nr:YaeQ family protein [Thermoanaerobaculia bacterium]
MALTATMHAFNVQLSNVDRGVYETFDLRVARQPSETAEYMLSRLLAYCLEYTEGIAFTEGVAAGNEPAVLVRDLTGRITSWIEVGAPDADRIHRATKLADRVAVYTHRPLRLVLEQLSGKKIHRVNEVALYTFGDGFIDEVSSALGRRNTLALTVTEDQLYLDVDGQTFTTTLQQHQIAA